MKRPEKKWSPLINLQLIIIPESELSSLSYIKMAQVTSFMGNNYSAIGYLGIVTGRKEKGDHLPLAYLTRGKIFLRMDEPEKAIKEFQILTTDYPRSKYAMEANFWIASYYHMMGLYEDAEKRLDEIAKSEPDLYLEYPEYLLLSAKNYLYLKKYDLARDYLFKAVNIGRQPETIDLLITRIGDTYFNQQQEKEANKYYRMVIDYYPKSEGASISKLRLADYFSDITILEDVSKENENEPIGDLAVLEKGYQLFERKEYSAVMDNLQELIEKPVQTETRKDAKRLFYNAAEKEISRLFNSEDYKGLIEMYQSRKMTISRNISPETSLMVGLAYKNNRMYEKAISELTGIKHYDLGKESQGKYFYGLASSYVGNGEHTKAKNLLENKGGQDLGAPDQQRLKILLADIYFENAMPDDALPLYQAAVKNMGQLDEDEAAEVYLKTGIILNKRKDYQNAVDALTKSILLLSKDTDNRGLLQSAHIELGNVFYSEKNYDQAIESYEKGFEIGYGPDRDDYWESRFRLATSYQKVGDDLKAEPLLVEISEDGDSIMQQRAQLRMGNINLERQLEKLTLGSTPGGIGGS